MTREMTRMLCCFLQPGMSVIISYNGRVFSNPVKIIKKYVNKSNKITFKK